MTASSDRPESVYLIPLSPTTEPATIGGPFPLTEDEWDQFMAVLEVIRPALTKPEET